MLLSGNSLTVDGKHQDSRRKGRKSPEKNESAKHSRALAQ